MTESAAVPESRPSRSRRKIQLLFAAKFAFSGLLLWLVLRKLDTNAIIARLRVADIRWLIPTLIAGVAATLLSAWRWSILSLGLLGFVEAVKYTWIGLFYGSIVPGVVGGDVAKGVSLAAKTARTRDSRLPVSIIADKLVGFWVLLLQFGLVASVLLISQPRLLPGLRGVIWLAGAFTIGGMAAAVAVCLPRGLKWFAEVGKRLPVAGLRSLAARMLAAVGSYSGKSRALWQAAMISFVIHALNAVSAWLVMHSLAIPATLWFAGVFYALLSVLLALPVSVSGIGVRDAFAASMFTTFGLNPESGVAFSWLVLGLGVVNLLVGAAIQLWEVFHRDD